MSDVTPILPAWWVSWYSPAPRSTFELHSPWWISGYAWDEDDNEVDILVAAVRASTETEALAQVCGAYDDPPASEDVRWRFCSELDRSPFSGRFPQAQWMAWDGNRTCACPAHSGSSAAES